MKLAPAMASGNRHAEQRISLVARRAFNLLFGGFLGLALLKFGNPPIMEKFIEPPTDLTEWLIMSWRSRWSAPPCLLSASRCKGRLSSTRIGN